MQGTIALLVALGGLGCHHKACTTTPVSYSSCYSSSCYSSSCYSSGYSGSSCYASSQEIGYGVATSCYSSCYSSSCYSSSSSCYSSCYSGGHFAKKWNGCGFFGHMRTKHYTPAPVCDLGSPVESSCYSAGYSMPVYGSYTPAFSVSYGSGQMTSPTSQGGTMMAPPWFLQLPR